MSTVDMRTRATWRLAGSVGLLHAARPDWTQRLRRPNAHVCAAADRLPRAYRAGVMRRAEVRAHHALAAVAAAEAKVRRRQRLTPAQFDELANYYSSLFYVLMAWPATEALEELQARARAELVALARHPEALAPLNLETAAGLDTAPPPPRDTEPHGAALIATSHASQAPPCPATGVCLSAPGGPP